MRRIGHEIMAGKPRRQAQTVPEADGKSLLLASGHTLRAKRVSGTELQGIVCVCLEDMADKVSEHIKEIDPKVLGHILREPSARNTAAAVALAALYCQKEFGDEPLMWVLPSDHYIGKEAVLGQALEEAKSSAEKGKLVTFGITPDQTGNRLWIYQMFRSHFGKNSPCRRIYRETGF